jgi:hypothetical protein
MGVAVFAIVVILPAMFVCWILESLGVMPKEE